MLWKLLNLAKTSLATHLCNCFKYIPKTRSCDVVLCTPAVMVPAMIKAGKECKVAAGAQDVSKYEKGAYTGEISAAQLADIGTKYCIVGPQWNAAVRSDRTMCGNEDGQGVLQLQDVNS